MKHSKQTFQIYADDFSGAAEMAGLAHERGWKCQLYRPAAQYPKTGESIPVFDLSTRDSKDVYSEWQHFLESIELTDSPSFVKIDSVLRGRVDQIVAALKTSGQKVLLLPGNPTSGRVCRNGQLTIDGTPLHETDFAKDPGNPASSSALNKLIDPEAILSDITYVSGTCVTGLPDSSTIVAQCPSIEAMQTWAKKALAADCTVVGSADAFAAWLACIGNSTTEDKIAPLDQARLFIAGSAHPRNAAWRSKLETSGTTVHILGSEKLCESISAMLKADKQAYLFTENSFSAGTDVATLLAEQIQQLIHQGAYSLTLCVDGGATAAAIAEKMGWQKFTVEHAYATGIVRLKPPSGIAALVVKPGSYEWPLSAFNPHSF